MKWNVHRTMACRLVLLSIAIALLEIPSLAQSGPVFLEGGAFSGGLLKPAGRRTTGFGVGVGRGRNFVGIDVSREFLGTYELGVGSGLDPNSSLVNAFTNAHPLPQSPISGSSAESLNGSIRRDLYSFHGKITAYGLAGAGYLKARSTETYSDSVYMNGHIFQEYCNCNPSTYGPLSFAVLKTARAAGLSLGSGVRVPITESLGLRAEFRARLTPSVTPDLLSPGVTLRDPNGNVIAPGGSPIVVGHVSGTGAPLKAEWLFGITFGVYYRIFNRHL